MDHKSSLTEMTGNRITINITRPTNDVRRSTVARRPSRSHRHALTIATNAQAELSNNSMLMPDFTTGHAEMIEAKGDQEVGELVWL